MKKLILIFFIFISNNLQAQNTNPEEERRNNRENSGQNTNPRITHPLGLTLNIGGPSTIVSASVDYFVHPNVSIAAGGGIFAYYGGAEYHFLGQVANQNWTPYLGLYVARVPEFQVLFDVTPTHTKLYMPIGAQYIGKKGFTFSPALGIMTTHKDDERSIRPWITIKLGTHFRLKG